MWSFLLPAQLVRARQQVSSMFASNYCAVQIREREKKKIDGGRQNPLYCFQKAGKDLHQVVHFAQHCNKQREVGRWRHEEARGRGRWQGARRRSRSASSESRSLFSYIQKLNEQNEKNSERADFQTPTPIFFCAYEKFTPRTCSLT